MSRRRAPLWRSFLSWIFLLIFCLAAPVALVTGWARAIVNDPAGYERAVDVVGRDPRVQASLADAVTSRGQALLARENPTATEAVIARQMAEVVGEAASEVFASEGFRDVWRAANRTAYALLVSGLNEGWGEPVGLDLSPLVDQLREEIDGRGLDLPVELTLDPATLRIEVLNSENADRVRRAVQGIDLAFGGSLAATLLSLLLAIGLAPDRLATTGRLAFGLALAMVILMLLLLVGQGWIAATAGEAGGGAALSAIVDAVSQGLRLSAIGLAGGGLLLAAIVAGLCALRRGMAPRTVDG